MNRQENRSTKTIRSPAMRSPGDQHTEQSRERYLSRARDEERAGNMIEAENYYQHAEHYFRSTK
ncbi:DUF4167 domain-containing protein [Phyllobacterium zundukense]|uniref:DUF4167 domain-containing protein n=1 Tax=Phyllobacterium zundukense TaxID=1867719 RepID=UPI003965BFCA